MSLGDRIKEYEAVTRHYATRGVPLMVRVDGRAFHTFTRDLEKPFDKRFQDAMVYAARTVAEDMQGFKAAYIQSDEATFCLTDYDSIESQGWFGYNLSKIISTSAAMMTAIFNKSFLSVGSLPTFDSRAFSVPVHDVVNAFLWRAKDWERNSLQMYARTFFNHKELIGKNRESMHEMLHKIGKNWATDLSDKDKNGIFLVPHDCGILEHHDIEPSYAAINEIIGGLVAYPE